MPTHLENGDSSPYWQGVREGKLLFQTCTACGAVQFPPRHHCASCWEDTLEWTASNGQGVVESYTIVRRAPLPAFRDKVPYVVASIALQEGPRMIANLLGEDALGVSIGDSVGVTFRDNEEGETLPQFQRLNTE